MILSRNIWPPALWIIGWLALLLTALAARPLLPMDETRYVSVAWEMWLSGDYLVPRLNGEPYSHKPPLLFWLINLGWAVFGVAEWWARVVSPLFALASLALIGALARKLWPERIEARELAPLMLLGGLFWGAYATLTMFDMLIGFFTLAALWGVLLAHGEGGWRGWVLTGLSLGLGVLAKGPVILVYVLPVAALAPLWSDREKPGRVFWVKWFAGLAGALALAAAIGLAWALPAAQAGGKEYADAILWSQTAGRMSQSFAHERAWWFYFSLTPLAMIPWIFLPSFWRGLSRAGLLSQLASQPGGRFCLIWFVVSVAVLSFVSGKQPHYLIPSIPALALLFAAVFSSKEEESDRRPRTRVHARAITGACILLLIVVHVALRPFLFENFDLRPLARHVAKLQDQGILVANVHKYHGQYQFLGRLKKPLAITWQHSALQWSKDHPNAKLIATHRGLPEGVVPEFVQKFRGREIAVWSAQDIINNRNIIVP